MRNKKNKGLLAYINERIWNVRLEDRNPLAAFVFKQLRIVLIVLRNYTRDKLQLQAAGLTYYTLLSVVPVVALIFAIAKGFGFQDALEEELLETLKGHEEVAEQILVFATKMLENTQGGLLAGIGVAVLLWSVLRLLASIELSFNAIFQVVKGRSWVRKFSEYFSIMLLAPVVILLAGSITVVITTEIENIVMGVDVLQSIGPIIMFLIKLIPYTLIWLVFTFVYMVIPNTKVNFKSAFIAGIIAGTSFQLVEWGYINFQVGVSKYNAIYGSFAALPLFLIWVNISWLITLIGAEVAYANQFITEIEHEVDSEKLSWSQQHIIALVLAHQIAASFENDNPPHTAQQLSKQLGLPFGVTAKVLERMVEAHLLSEVELPGDTADGFLPSRSMENMTAADVISAMDQNRHTPLPGLEEASLIKYTHYYNGLMEQTAKAEGNILIKDLPAIKS